MMKLSSRILIGALALLLPAAAAQAIEVNTLDDHNDGTCDATDCTLREALADASSQSSSTITFASGLSGTISLNSDMDTWTGNDVEIDGPAGGITISGGDDWIPFTVTGGNFTVRALTIAHGYGIGGATPTGGGVELNGGNFFAHDVLFYWNTGGSGSTGVAGAGGGVNVRSGLADIENCTFSQNLGGDGGDAATGDPNGGAGGAGAAQSADGLALINCTVADNFGGDGGTGTDFGGDAGAGGIGVTSPSGSFLIGNTLVAYNEGGHGGSGGTDNGDTYNDIFGAGLSFGHNIVLDSAGGSGYDTSDLLDAAAAPLKLDYLHDNGGVARTYAIKKGSVAIDAGDNSLVVDTTDGRGDGFDRIVNGTVDIGAFEWTATDPTASDGTLEGRVDTPFWQKLPGRDIDGDDLIFAIIGTLPDGLTLDTTTGVITGTPTSVLQGGTFQYTVSDGNTTAGPANITINIKEAPSLVVDTLSDSSTEYDGITSLRDAMTVASETSFPEITFDESLNGGTITLNSSLPSWNDGDNLQIVGPSRGVTVSGNDLCVPFIVQDSQLNLLGFTISHGKGDSGSVPSGGALRTDNASVLLENMTFTENTGGDGPAGTDAFTAPAGPGVVYAQRAGVFIINSTFYSNHGGAGGTGSGADGKGGRGGAGAVDLNNGQIVLANCTLTANTGGAGGSAGDGGAGDGGAGAFENDVDFTTSESNLIAGNTGGTGGSSTGTPATGLTPGDVVGSLGSIGKNLVGVSANGTDYDPSDILDPDPTTIHLLPLADNGGWVPTCALDSGSIAIDAGQDGFASSFGLDVDARGLGFPREVANGVDIGAFEADFVRPFVTIDTPPSNARMLISDFVPSLPSGTAVDDGIVNSVELSLSRSRGGVTSYWNGTAWSSTKARVPATLCGCTGPYVTVSWVWDTDFPAETDLDEGLYRLDAVAADGVGEGVSVTRLFTLLNENIAPQVTVNTPVANARLTPANFLAGTAAGTASDNVAVSKVTAKFYRVISGVKEYWNGTAWGGASANTPISVTGAGTANASWNLTSLPAANNMAAGAYYVLATATDPSGNTGAATRPFTIVDPVSDLIPPSITITGVTSGSKLVPSQFVASLPHGTATDNDQVASISAKLVRTISGVKQYWDGSVWNATAVTMPVNAPGLGTASTTWDAVFPTEPDLDYGSYSLVVTAKDATGNSASATLPFSIVTDTEKPVVTVTAPASVALVHAADLDDNAVKGTATDNVQVGNVVIKLYRTRGGVKQFWNGTSFGTTSVAAPANVTGLGTASVAWNLVQLPGVSDLDIGSYAVTVSATDTSGNQSLVVTRLFNVTTASGSLKFSPSGGSF